MLDKDAGGLRIKICCIASVDEMRLAVEHGANALGFVSKMPSGPGPIEEELIAGIVPHVPAGLRTFLLTSETTADPVIAQQRRTGVNTLQLVDAMEPGSHASIRSKLPAVSIVQVIHVMDRRSVDQAIGLAGEVDALLLDSGNPALAVKELGGTGRVHDWKLSREIRERSGVPVYLAGGLNASNVAEAIRTVRPFGVDICSGVRTNGKLDPEKLRRFTDTAREAALAG
jgi:phosphoribosylanthranilate isomerase